MYTERSFLGLDELRQAMMQPRPFHKATTTSKSGAAEHPSTMRVSQSYNRRLLNYIQADKELALYLNLFNVFYCISYTQNAAEPFNRGNLHAVQEKPAVIDPATRTKTHPGIKECSRKMFCIYDAPASQPGNFMRIRKTLCRGEGRDRRFDVE